MTRVRRESTETLDYVCPECGETFEEGESECGHCGTEFDWSEELEYLCPECGTMVDPDDSRCPGCGAKFSMEDEGEVLIEYEPDEGPPSVEEMLESAIDEVMVRPDVEGTGTDRGSEAAEGAVQQVEEGRATTTPGPPRPGATAAGAPPSRVVADVAAGPTGGRTGATGAQAARPHLYPGGFTIVGLVFVTLAVLALMFTVFMARYDTWVQGAPEESMGENQLMMFSAGLVAFAVFISIAVVDLLRTPAGLGEPLD